ncbi:MAG: hypothetical protein J6R24_03600 [Clostridia bacterium]|nr:hypothetical protein [Clostridia bacterium]
MKEVGPVLDFLEEHKGAVDVLSQMLNAQKAAPANYAETEQEKTQHKPHGDRAGENKNSQSPLEGIANEMILKGIQSYLANQAK